MREKVPDRLEAGRLQTGQYGTTSRAGFNGVFYVWGPSGAGLKIVASTRDLPGSLGWDHVSVSTQKRCPNWVEMCFVKNLFWDDEETVVQYHPPKSEYVNIHEFVLHLWRNRETEFPRPPKIFV